MSEFTYEIGGKTYTQKPLVLGQIRQLTGLMDGMVLPEDTGNVAAWVSVLGDRLPRAVAIVLCEEDTRLQDKDLDLFTREIEFEISPEQTIQVVQDFFACNPIASLLENLSGAVESLTEKIGSGDLKTGLKNLSSSSQGETSQNVKPSSGDTHSTNADRT